MFIDTHRPARHVKLMDCSSSDVLLHTRSANKKKGPLFNKFVNADWKVYYLGYNCGKVGSHID